MFGKRIYQRLINTSDIEPGSSEPPPKVGKQPQFQPDGLIRVGTGLEWHHFRRSGGNQSGVDYGFEHTNTLTRCGARAGLGFPAGPVKPCLHPPAPSTGSREIESRNALAFAGVGSPAQKPGWSPPHNGPGRAKHERPSFRSKSHNRRQAAVRDEKSSAILPQCRNCCRGFLTASPPMGAVTDPGDPGDFEYLLLRC